MDLFNLDKIESVKKLATDPISIATAIEIELDADTSVKIFDLPYFVASRWEAFKGRGKNDYRTSKDFEDLV